VQAYEAALPPHGWPNWVLGNHDKSRIASRVGLPQARVAAMLLLTLRGTPTLYYGDEIGMTDVPVPPNLLQDPWELNVPGIGLGRDPVRTPMQWDASPHAGFTTGTPWLPVDQTAKDVNVAVERTDPHSMLSLYRELIRLRHTEEALILGSYRPLSVTDDVMIYRRELRTRRLLVVLNFSAQPRLAGVQARGKILLSTGLDRWNERVDGELKLLGNEGIVAELE
jgi:alpha-glucosidase